MQCSCEDGVHAFVCDLLISNLSAALLITFKCECTQIADSLTITGITKENCYTAN